MARIRRFEVDELLIRPGTYFNPQTEVLVVVDDSPEIDQTTFDGEDAPDGGEWVLVSDELPLDEGTRDELLERFQARYQGVADVPDLDEEADADEDEEDDLEPDEDVEEL
jgi:hypothetical protein